MGKWDDSSDEEEESRNKNVKKLKKTDQKAIVEETSVTKESSLAKPQENHVPTDISKIKNVSCDLTDTIGTSSFINGCRSVDEYQRVSFINQGTYGVVYKALCLKTKDYVALKEIKMTPDSRKVGFPITALREINILLALRHPNIIRAREMVVGSTLDKIYMVMDYYDHDLKSCMEMAKQSFSTAEVKQLMLQLLTATDHMHNKWYIHRDLKTSNILYSNSGLLCICDFGLARRYGSPIAPYTHEVVTLWYRAPELLLGSRTYSTPLDVWSVGCIFAEMLTGKPLFPGQGEVDQTNLIFKALGMPTERQWPGVTSLPHYAAMSWRNVTSKGKLREMFPSASFSGGVFLNDTGFDLLSRLLHMDPKQRLTAGEALRHPWLTEEEPRPCDMALMPKFYKKQKAEENTAAAEEEVLPAATGIDDDTTPILV